MEINIRQLLRIPEPIVSVRDRPTQLPTSFHSRYKPLTLWSLDRLLIAYSQTRKNLSQICEKLNISLENSKNAIEVATQIERLSGFSGYQLQDTMSDPILRAGDGNKQGLPRKLIQKPIDRELMEKANRCITSIDMTIIESGTNSWISTYHPSGLSNLVTELAEAESLLNFYNHLIIDIDTTIYLIEEIPELRKLASSYGYKSDTIKINQKIPLAVEKSRTRRYGRVEFKSRLMNFQRSHMTFNRIIFLMAVVVKGEF